MFLSLNPRLLLLVFLGGIYSGDNSGKKKKQKSVAALRIIVLHTIKAHGQFTILSK